MTPPRILITPAIVVLLFVGSSVAAQETSEQFRLLDRNKDGKLARAEVPDGLKQAFDLVDTNKDGIITPEEDQAFVRRRGAAQGPAPKIPETIRSELELPYAATDNPRQRLDLYLPKSPEGDKPLPLVVFIHGGGWQNGDKQSGAIGAIPLVQSGQYAAASIGYRLTGEAMWPAQIHDCKAAIRWLRAHAKKYNLDPEKIGVVGSSAGGHLAAMLGTSGAVSSLDGSMGEHLTVSSRVACVVDLFGPTDFLALSDAASSSPKSAVYLLLGGSVKDNQETARAASPVSYVSADNPPFLIVHGTDDPIVPFQQSELLLDALKKTDVQAALIRVEGGGHGGFVTPEVNLRVRQFLDKRLLGKDVSISTEPIPVGRAGRAGS
jgi:acetyl esterase/lipase